MAENPPAPSKDELAQAKAEQAARDLEVKLIDGASIDEEAGDLVKDGRQVIRVGKVVRVATHDGAKATEYGTVDKAKAAFKDAAP